MARPVPAPTPIATYGAPVTVVGPEFVAPYPVDLAVVRKVMSWSGGSFVVTDSNGTIIFKVKGHVFTVHDRRELLDANEKPLVTLYEKIFSAHDRWQAFKGESKDEKDLLFTVKRSKVIQIKTKLNIYLGTKSDEGVCDYRVEGSWSERSCVIYAGESNDMVAQMHKKETVKSMLIGKDHFSVTVYPNVDYAFIVAIIVILDGINMEDV